MTNLVLILDEFREREKKRYQMLGRQQVFKNTWKNKAEQEKAYDFLKATKIASKWMVVK